MQIICNSLQTDNHAIASTSLNILQARSSSRTNNVKALKVALTAVKHNEYCSLEALP